MTVTNLPDSIPSLARFASDDPECPAALERVRPLLAAIPGQDVTGVNGDIPMMASIALGAYPHCARYRADLASLPGDYAIALDGLPDAARAVVQAQANVAAASGAAGDAATLGDECTKARAMLAKALLALADRGYVDARKVRENLRGKSRIDTSRNTLALVTMFEDRWDRVHAKTAITADEIHAVRVLAERLVASVGVRDHGPLGPREVVVIRDRAFAYFKTTYAKVRRAIQFVRGEAGDADRIAPSLWNRNAAATRAPGKAGARRAEGKSDGGATAGT